MHDETRVDMDDGRWVTVMGSRPKLLRMNVPGGWLVTVAGGISYSVSFYPDPEHTWNPQIKK
jgi:hypothetical protein